MGRNIILCSDGTGNLGGTTPDSNVFKLFNAIDIHSHEPNDAYGNPKPPKKEQITFYDEGVGTSSNKYVRAITGSVGIGFGKNVQDMYRFLAKNYRDGDDIYIFGFSRGAATVRAFSGFVAHCGLIDGKKMTGLELEDAVEELFRRYSRGKPKPDKFEYLNVRIKFIGVWDTVSALGTPQRAHVPGTIMKGLNYLFLGVGWVADKFKPHLFYNYELTKNVENAFQALAIDDERTSFWPMVWDEKKCAKDSNVEQVWFAGMHSNVGGGYPRAGMANVAFYWMLERLKKYGDLEFDGNVEQEAYDKADPNGLMYNSRGGAAVLFRYHPREITALCAGKLKGPIKIHKSVLERMDARTANYGPAHMPGRFEVATSEVLGGAPAEICNPEDKIGWQDIQKSIGRLTLSQKWLYALFLDFWIVVAAAAFWLWIDPPIDKATKMSPNWLLKQLADILDYFTPQFFDAFIQVVVLQSPHYLLIGVSILVIIWRCAVYFRRKTEESCEDARTIVLKSCPAVKK